MSTYLDEMIKLITTRPFDVERANMVLQGISDIAFAKEIRK